MTENQVKAKRLLEEIKENELHIKKKRMKVELLRIKVHGRAIQYDTLKVKSSVTNITEEMMADIADLEKEIEAELEKADKRYCYAYTHIKELKSLDEQNVLLGYYFDDYTYEELAVHLDMSRRTLKRIEENAFEHLGIYL